MPSTARVPRSITPLFASVVAARLPPTVTVPLSVILPPAVTVRLPVVVRVFRSNALLSLIVTDAMVPDEANVTVLEKVLD